MNNPRQPLTAQLHIGKKELCLDDDTYRALLKGATGKTSSKDMSVPELHKAIHAMKLRGFKPKAASSKMGKRKAPSRVGKMKAIWINMGHGGFIDDASDSALLHWVQGELKKRNADPIDSLTWLDTHRECNKIIEQLKRWRDRVVKAGLNDDLNAVSDAQAAFDNLGLSRSQKEIILFLLSYSVITWHSLFKEMGLERQGHYISNRKQLRELTAVMGEENLKCS